MDIITTNWPCQYGQIDLIARDERVTVFVEVATVSSPENRTPVGAISFTRQRRIRRLALLWLGEQDGPWRRIRFDAVSVVMTGGGEPEIDHLTAVF